jgi:asparaginyl-tRNA synthetase
MNHLDWLEKTIIIGGWIRTVRKSSNNMFIFAEINDGSCVNHLQIIIENNLIECEYLKYEGIGCSVLIKGKIVSSIGTKQTVT